MGFFYVFWFWKTKYTLFSIEPASIEWYFFKKETKYGAVYSEITWEALAALLPENLNRSVEMAEGGSPRGSTEKG